MSDINTRKIAETYFINFIQNYQSWKMKGLFKKNEKCLRTKFVCKSDFGAFGLGENCGNRFI